MKKLKWDKREWKSKGREGKKALNRDNKGGIRKKVR